ncbi:myelin-associated glycoprotein-like isoform X3 [Acanthopagrus latus]|nr:myelin-associated glycoprotein-like isoform X3 [Acanthopagrus latus]
MGTARLLKLLSLFMGFSVLQQVRGWVISVPKTVTAVEGSCVVVPCQTQPHSRVIWYKYHNTVYPVVYDGHSPHKVEDQFEGRTSVVGKATEGNCTLKINDVRSADNNIKVYVWINPDSKSTQKFHHQTVTISVIERKAPTISIQEQIMDGDILQANCSIIHSCPSSPPSLLWSKSQFLKNSTVKAFSQEMQGQWLYTETLQGLAMYEMHRSNMMCSAQFSSFTTKSQQKTLDILYKPVTVTLMLAKKAVTEGGSITVECAANCNPPPHTYTWLKREMGQITKITSTLSRKPFINITRDTFILCIAHNDIGEGQSDWLDLDVQYAPVILPKSYCHLTGEVLKCVCQVEAHPDAVIHWTIDGNDTLPSSFSAFSTNQTHVLSGVISGQAQSHSKVSCTATNTLGNSTKKLSVNSSETSFLSTWLTVSIILGFAVLFGCTVLIFRKCSRDRPPPGSVCNNTILSRPQGSSDSVQLQSPIYNNPQRSEEDDSQSSPYRPESNPEVESRVSDVYDNDCVTDFHLIRAQQLHSKETAHLREGQKQSLDKTVDCNTDVYLNC